MLVFHPSLGGNFPSPPMLSLERNTWMFNPTLLSTLLMRPLHWSPPRLSRSPNRKPAFWWPSYPFSPWLSAHILPRQHPWHLLAQPLLWVSHPHRFNPMGFSQVRIQTNFQVIPICLSFLLNIAVAGWQPTSAWVSLHCFSCPCAVLVFLPISDFLEFFHQNLTVKRNKNLRNHLVISLSHAWVLRERSWHMQTCLPNCKYHKKA